VLIEINDPVARLQVHPGHAEQGGAQQVLPGPSAQPVVLGGVLTGPISTESLGTRTIDGVLVEGTRTTDPWVSRAAFSCVRGPIAA